MTIELIDNTVNAVLVGLVYGGEAWLVGAFILHVAKRWRQAAQAKQETQIAVKESISVKNLQSKSMKQGFIEMTILDSGDKNAKPQSIALQSITSQNVTSPNAHKNNAHKNTEPQEISTPSVTAVPTVSASTTSSGTTSSGTASSSTVSSDISSDTDTLIKEPFTQKGLCQGPTKSALSINLKTPTVIQSDQNQKQTVPSKLRDKRSAKRLPLEVKPSTETDIVCEPVNWKLWRVADLRKASVAKACGVRTRPIGSRRNLLKADLIAQYQQNLKRLTKPAPVKQAGMNNQERIA